MSTATTSQERAFDAAVSGNPRLGIPQALDDAFPADAKHAAGTLFVAPDGDVLLLRRSGNQENFAGHWALPGGNGEDGETPEQIAAREEREELGEVPQGGYARVLDKRLTPTGMLFTTFAKPIQIKFTPTLNDEHSGYAWASLDMLPEPLHPAVKTTIAERLGLSEDLSDTDFRAACDNFAGWVHGAGMETVALDEASARRIDADGHLHVAWTPISKANICEYFGREIPNGQALGLDPDKLYRLYRDPAELEKGAASFAGKPLLALHKPVSASDHPREIVAGAIGTDVRFEAPYLMAPVTVWDAESIRGIQTRQKRQLSSAYRYVADMVPGNINGEPFDGTMRSISANHVALVPEGRAGPDVMVFDSMPTIPAKDPPMKRTVSSLMAATTLAGLTAFLSTRLAQDAKVDLLPAVEGLTPENFTAKRPAITAAVTAAVAGKLAQDQDMSTLPAVLDSMASISAMEMMPKNGTAADDWRAGVLETLKANMGAEEYAACAQLIGGGAGAMDADDDDEKKEKDEKEKPAMDAAAVQTAISSAVEAEKVRQRNLRTAEDRVRPWVGTLAVAMDSAPDVYRAALKAVGVKDADGLHDDALWPVLQAQPQPGQKRGPALDAPVQMAADAASIASFAEMFPEAQTRRFANI